MTDDIDDIKPNEICEMTTLLDRAFRAVGCVPQCHCCREPILILQKFKLAYIKRPGYEYESDKSKDEMLCSRCTPTKLLRAEKKYRAKVLKGGFSRIHQ